MAIWISLIKKTEMTCGWQVAMYQMIKYQLNCLRHISSVTDGVWYQLLIKNCIWASLLAKKTIDFPCYLSHCFRLKSYLPQ